MQVRQKAVITAAMLAVILSAVPARALTAGYVMDEMNSDQRQGFFSAAVEMASHFFSVDGNLEKARCAVDWLYERESTLPEIYAFFDAHKDREAVGLVHVLINRKCGQ